MEPQEPRGQVSQPPQAALPNEPYYATIPKRQAADRRPLAAALIIVGLIWLLSNMLPGLPSLHSGLRDRAPLFDQSVAAQRLFLDANAADVELMRGTTNEIRIQAFREGGADTDYTVNLSTEGDLVRVGHSATPCFFLCNRNLTYVVTLPAQAQVAVQTSSGDVVAENLACGTDVHTLSGDIELSAVSGPVTIATTSGDVSIEDGNIAGANISTTSGSVEIAGVTDALVISTVSGDVDVFDARGATLTLATTSGDIDYRGSLDAEADHTISTISGDVGLELPEGIGLQLDVSSVSGSLETDFSVVGTTAERSLSGTIGAGGPKLSISTTSGDVAIEED